LGPISYNEEGAQIVKALWKGHEVVVKKCDIYNQHAVVAELEHEAMIYKELQELQGECIPTLWIAGVANGLEMILVTEFVGTNISQERLDDSDRAQIRQALCAIHQLGVAHGDIRLENIVIQRKGLRARFFFIDFGMSYTTEDRAKLSHEMKLLDLLLNMRGLHSEHLLQKCVPSKRPSLREVRVSPRLISQRHRK
jgi:tRNA A-37 threonylcarbamoyl transferase component Bud32